MIVTGISMDLWFRVLALCNNVSVNWWGELIVNIFKRIRVCYFLIFLHLCALPWIYPFYSCLNLRSSQTEWFNSISKLLKSSLKPVKQLFAVFEAVCILSWGSDWNCEYFQAKKLSINQTYFLVPKPTLNFLPMPK